MKHRLLLVGFGFLLAVLYDIFFWKQGLGLGFVLYVALYVVGYSALLGYFKLWRQKWAFLLLVPIFVLSFNIAILNNFFVKEWSPLLVGIFTFAFSLLVPLQNPHKFQFSFFHIPFLRGGQGYFKKVQAVVGDLFSFSKFEHKQVVKKVALGVVIAVPLLLIFGALFTDADAIFRDWLNTVFDFDIEADIIWRIFRTVVFTLLFGSLFYVFVGEDHILNWKPRLIKKFDGVVLGTVLSLVNILFLIFVIIQISYLFGSKEFVFESGLKFADYARAGFFQLAWVVALSAFMMAIVYRSSSAHKSHPFITFLQLFLIVQVGVIAASALKRMNLYQDEFGFTVLRLYVEWCIYFVMAVLLFAGVSILIRFPFWKFFYGSLITGVVALTVVGSLNVDKIIAAENVRRFASEGKSIDVSYLSTLSVDAWPTALSLFIEHPDKFSLGEMVSFKYMASEMEEKIKNSDTFFETNKGISDATIFWNEKKATLLPLVENAEARIKAYRRVDSEMNPLRASEDTRNCFDLPYQPESGHFMNTRTCVPVFKSETEQYLVMLSWELDRSNFDTHTDIYVYKIFKKNEGLANQYTPVFSKSFPLSVVPGASKYSQNYQSRFFLLSSGVLVESSEKLYQRFYYQPVFDREKSTLLDKKEFNTVETLKAL